MNVELLHCLVGGIQLGLIVHSQLMLKLLLNENLGGILGDTQR
jgi:hypothetical protein